MGVTSLGTPVAPGPVQDRLMQAVTDELNDKGFVIAQVDNEWTMKYYDKTGSQVRLIAANKKYPPIKPREELKIGGVIVAVIRKYR